MSDVDPAVRRRFQQQRRQGTGPEMALRRALHASGHRYRVQLNVPGLNRRTIDIAFTRQKVAVFIDGCFWHGCPEHYVEPKTRVDFWRQKVAANQARDAQTTEELMSLGWTVVRAWEHQPTDQLLSSIEAALGGS